MKSRRSAHAGSFLERKKKKKPIEKIHLTLKMLGWGRLMICDESEDVASGGDVRAMKIWRKILASGAFFSIDEELAGGLGLSPCP